MNNKQTHIPQGYKQSPLGIIPQEWEVKRLGEMFSFKNGINSEKENYGRGVKFVNTMDVLGCSCMTNDTLRGSMTATEKQQVEFAVSSGDILFNRTSETREDVGCASVYIDSKKAVFGGFIIRARSLDNSIDNFYKKYCFKIPYVRKQISSFGNGAIRYNLGQEDLAKVLLALPPLPEQEKIAEVLSVWDEAIERQAKLTALLQKRKRALMQRLLTNRNNSQDHEVLKKYIVEISERRKQQKDLPVLSVTNSRGFINQTEQFDREVASADSSNYKVISRGQFAYNPSRVNVGSLDLLSSFEIGILSPMYVVFQTIEDKLSSTYLYYLLKSNWFTAHIPMYVQGSVRDSLSFDGLRDMKFYIPTLSEQKSIAERLSTADTQIDLAKTKLALLRTQKKGLMQQLLTGKKRVRI